MQTNKPTDATGERDCSGSGACGHLAAALQEMPAGPALGSGGSDWRGANSALPQCAVGGNPRLQNPNQMKMKNPIFRTYHELIGDFGRHKTKRQYVKAGVLFEELDRRLLVDHHGQRDHGADVQERRENAGSLGGAERRGGHGIRW